MQAVIDAINRRELNAGEYVYLHLQGLTTRVRDNDGDQQQERCIYTREGTEPQSAPYMSSIARQGARRV